MKMVNKKQTEEAIKEERNNNKLSPNNKHNNLKYHVSEIIRLIGDNPQREGIYETPHRVAKMYNEVFKGYDVNQKPKITVFNNGSDGVYYDQMITDTGYFYSFCEHHMIPFFGQYWFAYIPSKKGKLLGLSKVARLVEYHSAKLQIQERLVKNIVDDIEEALTVKDENGNELNKPLGVALILEGKHLCKCMRGVRNDGVMTTSDMRGVFKEYTHTKQEFIALTKEK